MVSPRPRRWHAIVAILLFASASPRAGMEVGRTAVDPYAKRGSTHQERGAASQGYATSRATEAEIIVGEDVRLAEDPGGRPLVEPHLSADSSEPDHLLVGVIALPPDMTGGDCVAYTSFDGAESWIRHPLGLRECGDPWGAILDDGTAVLTVLGIPPDSEEEAPELLVYRSEDGGRTWPDPPLSLGRGHDHQTLAVDRTGGTLHGSLYVASAQIVRRPEPERYLYSVFLARSTDGGRSFADTARVFPMGASLNAMTPAVLSDGTLVVPYSDYARRTFGGGEAALEVERDWALVSTDGGRTFSPPFMVGDECERSWSELAVDASDGPHRDRLYYVCNDDAFERVLMHRSADSGISWSDPETLNRESGRRPYARTPAVEVNEGGVPLVTFHDGRGQPAYMGIFRCQRVYATASVDGGETWLPEVAISSEPSCPITPENGQVGMRFPQGGDYHGLAALSDGSFRVVWSDARNGRFALRTAVVTVREAAAGMD